MLLYILRMILLSFAICISALASLPFCLIRPFNPRNVDVFCRFLDLLSRTILGHKFTGDDLTSFKKLEGRIFISNHQSNLDLLYCAHVVPSKTVSVGKSSLKWIPFFGQFYWLSGNVLIDRSNTLQAIGTLEKGIHDLIKHKSNLWEMPEGTRSKGRGLMKFKKGAFRMAKASGLPIVPVCFSCQKNTDYKKWNSGEIKITILPEIRIAEDENINDVMQRTWQEMNKTLYPTFR